MLVLSRRREERIRVGDDIWITVREIRDKSVSIGIDAPSDVIILREELIDDDNTYQKAQKEKK